MTTNRVRIANRLIGHGEPIFIVAEIGINHNGSIENAKKLIDAAANSGCDAVKFQKRDPESCVPIAQRNINRETPWGTLTYLDYRKKIEFGQKEYEEIDDYCRAKKIHWFASCWDQESVEFLMKYDPICFKIPSALLTNDELLIRVNQTGVTTVLSTGMSTIEEIRHAASLLDRDRLILTHTTSTYPCRPNELNLKMINTLEKEFHCPIGYSGHEVGLQTTVAAAAIGASLIERHITLDRTMWGTDQAASVEPVGLIKLVRDIRVVESALGTGIKKVYDSEKPALDKLRKATKK